MNKKEKSKKMLYTIPVLIILIIISIICLNDYSIYNFTTEKWQQIGNRTKIVDSMLRKHNLIGMTPDEVEYLLGKPSRERGSIWIYDLKFKPEPGELQHSLEIIPFLRIDFEDGLVKSYEVDSNP